MDENHQDKTESKQAATGETLPPLSSKDQSKPEHQAQSHAGKAFAKSSTSKAIHLRLAIALSIAMVGVIVLIYLCFWLNWSLWSLIPLTLVGILLLIFLIREGYYAQWTGFREYVKETKEYTDGQSTTTTRDQQPGKTLWDWLQLLIIPVVLASATLGFGLWQAKLAQQQHDNDQKLAQQQHDNDQEIARDQQQASILQTYIDNIQELLLKENLLKSKPDDDVAILARARTLTALQGLDPDRKGRLVKFLYEAHYEAHLIGFISLSKGEIFLSEGKLEPPIIILDGADLSDVILYTNTNSPNLQAGFPGASFFDVNLSNTNLSHISLFKANFDIANLTNADFTETGLGNAYLSNAVLTNAKLTEAYLDSADLSQAQLSNANLTKAILDRADLHDAVLSCLPTPHQLQCTNLTDAGLRGANLRGANLRGANLWHADLSCFILPCTDLTNANLNGAVLFGANLNGAVLGNICKNGNQKDCTNLNGARYNSKPIQETDLQGEPKTDVFGKPIMIPPTQWPQGFDPQAAGAIICDSYNCSRHMPSE